MRRSTGRARVQAILSQPIIGYWRWNLPYVENTKSMFNVFRYGDLALERKKKRHGH